jgi:hypothetical protein
VTSFSTRLSTPMVRASVATGRSGQTRTNLTAFARLVCNVGTCAASRVRPHSAIPDSICPRRFENSPIRSSSTPAMSARPSWTGVHPHRDAP